MVIRHNNAEFYVTETAVMIRELYKFGYIHHKILHDPKTHITLKDMNRELEKSGELQRRLQCTFLSHMENGKKDGKYV